MSKIVFWTCVGMKDGLFHLVCSDAAYPDRYVDPGCFGSRSVVTYGSYVEREGFYYYAG